MNTPPTTDGAADQCPTIAETLTPFTETSEPVVQSKLVKTRPESREREHDALPLRQRKTKLTTKLRTMSRASSDNEDEEDPTAGAEGIDGVDLEVQGNAAHDRQSGQDSRND